MTFKDITQIAGGLLTGDTSAELKAAALVKMGQSKVNSQLEKTGGDLAKSLGAGIFGGLFKGAQKVENSQLEKTASQIGEAIPREYKLLGAAAALGLLWLIVKRR